MAKSTAYGDNSYRLVMGQGGGDESRTIEFRAAGAHSALFVAGQHCRGRQAEVFENGRLLCSILNDATDGFWVIAPPAARDSVAIPA